MIVFNYYYGKNIFVIQIIYRCILNGIGILLVRVSLFLPSLSGSVFSFMLFDLVR